MFGMRKKKLIEGFQKRSGYIYKKIGENSFDKSEMKIPEGYKKIQKKKILEKDNMYIKKHPTSKYYFTHNNGDRKFLVYIGKEVSIYRKSDKYEIDSTDYSKNAKDNRWMYIKLVARYNPLKVFLGKSLKTEMTKISGGYGKEFDGNTILINVTKNKYVFIGDIIYKFTTTDNIEELISPIGNNLVSYPVAFGENNIYFLLDNTYIPKNKIHKYNKKFKEDAYAYYYGHIGDELIKKHERKMDNWLKIYP
jgi:hypothetical protein